jgi:hypothetical protein
MTSFSHDHVASPCVYTDFLSLRLLWSLVWVTCPYYDRDGLFNPDYRTVNNSGAFAAMSDAVLYNTLAWVITGSSQYATNAASWINTWFVANNTYMNPNLNYAQVVRGPGPTANIGRNEGVLDLKCMVKIVNAVLVLRAGNAPCWTSEIDEGLVAWTESYIRWLTSSPIALSEAAATKYVIHHANIRPLRTSRTYSLCADELAGGYLCIATMGPTIITSLRRCRFS